MKPWKVILATLVIFGAGVMTGALAVRIAAQTKQRVAAQPGHGPKQKAVKPVQKSDFLGRLERELALTAEQRTQVEKALGESHKRTKALWEPLQPQFQAEVGRVEGEIRECLKPEQLAKFEQLIKPRVAAKTDATGEEPRGKTSKPLRPPTLKPPMIPAPGGDKKGGGTNGPAKADAPPEAATPSPAAAPQP